MLPPVYQTIQSPELSAIVGDKIGRHGSIEQGTQAPYVTWSLVSGQPYDQLSGTPPSDFMPTQIDSWSMDDAQVEVMASTIRTSLDAARICNRIVINQREPDTKLYRIGIEADFITHR
ncbi:DUF3168 domain-containing protein [Lysobacter sp. Root96]|uniref:tail completion protein gp17 n=1 Tax=Lysobacter sp. Root96 TaxID=1736612 RepID=UPI0006F2BFB5|nr:DUF3168 domain-containing protein [Lysobacter sp. Root96]KRD71448.1 hypothetical protein ASE45_06465 [Lysobacter sp. Root96]